MVNKDNRCDVAKKGVVDSSFAVLEEGIATLFSRLSSAHPCRRRKDRVKD